MKSHTTVAGLACFGMCIRQHSAFRNIDDYLWISSQIVAKVRLQLEFAGIRLNHMIKKHSLANCLRYWKSYQGQHISPLAQ